MFTHFKVDQTVKQHLPIFYEGEWQFMSQQEKYMFQRCVLNESEEYRNSVLELEDASSLWELFEWSRHYLGHDYWCKLSDAIEFRIKQSERFLESQEN